MCFTAKYLITHNNRWNIDYNHVLKKGKFEKIKIIVLLEITDSKITIVL